MGARERLEAYLRDHGVRFTIEPHPTTYTARELAAVAGVPAHTVAKVVVAFADSAPVMLVLPATAWVHVRSAARALGAGEVRLATEDEIANLFPDSEVGAEPPFGNLYGIPVVVERDLATEPEIVFPAGTHHELMRMRYEDFARLVAPTLARFEEQHAAQSS